MTVPHLHRRRLPARLRVRGEARPRRCVRRRRPRLLVVVAGLRRTGVADGRMRRVVVHRGGLLLRRGRGLRGAEPDCEGIIPLLSPPPAGPLRLCSRPASETEHTGRQSDGGQSVARRRNGLNLGSHQGNEWQRQAADRQR